MEDEDPIEEPEVEETDQPDSGADTAEEVEEEESPTPAATEEPWKRVRNDLYRRQSQTEAQLNRLMGMVEGLSQTRGNSNGASPQPPANPYQDRMQFQQDPLGTMEKVMERKLADTEERLARRLTEQSSEKQLEQSFYSTYPEMKDTGHAFYQEANEKYLDLVRQGLPEGYKTAMVAARLAGAESPQLREKSLRERRRSSSDKTTNEVIANKGRMDVGAPRSRSPKPAAETSRITNEDHEIAKLWKVNLEDKKTAEWIKSEKTKLQSQRYDRKQLDED